LLGNQVSVGMLTSRSKLIRPPRLKAGDNVAVVSPSWGGPGAFPHRYAAGKAELERTFGVSRSKPIGYGENRVGAQSNRAIKAIRAMELSALHHFALNSREPPAFA
jgi:hypothetical protein